MPSNVLDQLRAVLPLGEYSDIERVEKGGLIASVGGIIATARCLREGGVPCVVKALPVVSSSGAEHAELVLDIDRLRRIEAKLLNLDNRNPRPPIVPLFDVFLSTDPTLLVISMLRVTPATEYLSESNPEPHPDLAAAVLETIWPDAETTLFHWDISPGNVGFTARRRPCMLDLESIYVSENPTINVTLPAQKMYRLPDALRQKLLRQEAHGWSNIPTALAREKQEWETALLAAELCLGVSAEPHITRYEGRDRQWIESLAAKTTIGPVFANMWTEELHAFADHGRPLNVTRLLSASRNCRASRSPESPSDAAA